MPSCWLPVSSSRETTLAEDAAPVHRLYGLRVACRLPLRLGPLPPDPSGAGADIGVTIASVPPPQGAAAEPEVCWESPEPGPSGAPDTRLERRGPWWRMSFNGVGDFWIGQARVVAVPAPGADPELVELRLLGPVLAFCLELRGVVTLHASAVAVDGRAVAFLATHGGGKSSLAAASMRQGADLLTDDLLALDVEDGAVRARPGYPQMRMWPAAAEHFTGAVERWPRVLSGMGKRRIEVGEGGFGAFQPAPVPLAAILLPEHRADAAEVCLEPVAPAAAVMALLAGSYLPRLAPAAGLHERRLALLGRLVEAVPVRRLVYPRGFDRLDATAVRLLDLVRGGLGPEA